MTQLWWILPTIFTCGCLAWSIWWPVDNTTFYGIFTMFVRFRVALLLSLIAWIVAAVLRC